MESQFLLNNTVIIKRCHAGIRTLKLTTRTRLIERFDVPILYPQIAKMCSSTTHTTKKYFGLYIAILKTDTGIFSYVGKTQENIETRWFGHGHSSHFNNAVAFSNNIVPRKKYGIDHIMAVSKNPILYIFLHSTYSNPIQLAEAETSLIQSFGKFYDGHSMDLVNIRSVHPAKKHKLPSLKPQQKPKQPETVERATAR